MINIKPNDYVVPTDVREEVVQAICDAFLSNCCWCVFHPHSTSAYRRATLYVVKHKGDTKYYGFIDEPFSRDEGIKVRGVEMKAAFNELRNAGYHMCYKYYYGNWKGYECFSKPHNEGYAEVTDFNDFID